MFNGCFHYNSLLFCVFEVWKTELGFIAVRIVQKTEAADAIILQDKYMISEGSVCGLQAGCYNHDGK